MPESVTTKAIKFVSAACAADLRSHGFQRCAPHLLKHSNDLYHCIHFQGSQWGSREEGSFTVNLAVVSPAIYRFWTGRPLPKNPATALWPIQQRLGNVCPEKRDMWWDVKSFTDLADLATDISKRLQVYGKGLFTPLQSSSDLLQMLQNGITPPGIFEPQVPLIRAMILMDRGQREEATASFAEAFARSQVDGFRDTLETIAGRMGLSLTDLDTL